jgi:hypothetical protein
LEKEPQSGKTTKNEYRSDEIDLMKIQYAKLAEDWRQFNTILWGIPAIAVSIMAGIIVVAYQPGLAGWPRFVSLAIGSLFLFALTIEVIKKRVHMNAISDILKELQGPNGLNLKCDFIFPVGISGDVENYWKVKRERHKKELKEYLNKPNEDWLFRSYELLRSDKRERHKKELKEYLNKPNEDWLFRSYELLRSDVKEPTTDWLFRRLRYLLARKHLAYVIFFATIAVAILAVIELGKMIFIEEELFRFNKQADAIKANISSATFTPGNGNATKLINSTLFLRGEIRALGTGYSILHPVEDTLINKMREVGNSSLSSSERAYVTSWKNDVMAQHEKEKQSDYTSKVLLGVQS